MSTLTTSDDRPAFNLGNFLFADSVHISQAIRGLGEHAGSQQQAAQRLVDYLYSAFRNPASGAADTALVRCFKTHPLASLPGPARAAALAALAGGEAPANLRCLTLLGTRGECAGWNQPETSAGHQAIPLPDAAMVERAPMISALLSQMGVDVEQLVAPSEASLLLDKGQRSFNVFHVEDARGSSLIPAQQTFVIPFGIRSVVGMGGLMPSGELFAVILFAKVPVSRDVAELFRTLALSVKLLFLPFTASQVFASPPA